MTTHCRVFKMNELQHKKKTNDLKKIYYKTELECDAG